MNFREDKFSRVFMILNKTGRKNGIIMSQIIVITLPYRACRMFEMTKHLKRVEKP
jgi:hypothetical protein